MYAIRSYYAGHMGIGAAIASNWMSAASFLGIAGVFFLKGYFALAFVIGWTGGYRITSYNVCYTKLLRCSRPG